MPDDACIGANVARFRLDRQLTQEQLAARAGMSRMALGKIERGAVVPRAGTVRDLAAALDVPVGELTARVRALKSVRFRAKAQVHGREQILAAVSKWLDAYSWLEDELSDRPTFPFEGAAASAGTPTEIGRVVRSAAGLLEGEPVRNISRLLEDNGVKLLLLQTTRDSFFGLSVGKADGGPAVVVNTWDRISVERWIFTAAHELGHLLLHPTDYRREATEMPSEPEQEADAFASEFLMPEAAFSVEWDATSGHSLLVRVLKVKRIFRVSYMTVLRRLTETGRANTAVWRAFQHQHRERFGRTLRKIEEPEALAKSEFAWDWRRSGEPVGLSEHDFVEDRLLRLVRRALEEERISLGRAAEILGLTRDEMRMQVGRWKG